MVLPRNSSVEDRGTPTGEAKSLAEAKLKYTFVDSLLRNLCGEQKENFVVSPLNLGTALGMLTAAATGETKCELLQLFATADEDELHDMFSAPLSEEGLPLTSATKILADQEVQIVERLETLLKVNVITSMNA